MVCDVNTLYNIIAKIIKKKAKCLIQCVKFTGKNIYIYKYHSSCKTNRKNNCLSFLSRAILFDKRNRKNRTHGNP